MRAKRSSSISATPKRIRARAHIHPAPAASSAKQLHRALIDAAEAREQLTATAEILRVMSRSPGDLEPTFQTILARATRLCEAHLGLLYRYDGDVWTAVAFHGATPAFIDFLSKGGPIRPGPKTALARLAVERQPIHIADVLADAAYEERDPLRVAQAERGKARTLVAVPMSKDSLLLGAIVIYRPEVRPFTEHQVELVRTFADQAAIAIENVRLFNETKEALEQQTATAEILRVISQSPTDLQPVMSAIAEHAGKVCGAADAVVYQTDGEMLRPAANYGSIVPQDALLLRINRRSVTGRAFIDRETVHVEDLASEVDTEFPDVKEIQKRFGHRTTLATPLLRNGISIGAILIRRWEVRPFSDRQIGLLKTFAAQAVIAIENVRLFNETKEALERQTATAEILSVISSSPTDVQPVFEAIARNALTLCGSEFANVFRYDGRLMHYAASHQVAPEQIELVKQGYPAPPSKGRAAGRAILSRSVVCIEDALADSEYDHSVTAGTGWRRMFAAPMLREGEPLGAIAVGWTESGPIPIVQRELLKAFADQAVIAIENVRLFKELQARNAQVTEALEQQVATGEVLRVISRSPTDTQPVFDSIAESAARLCGASDVIIRRAHGDVLRAVAHFGSTPVMAHDIAITRGTVSGSAVVERRTIHIHDILEAYSRGEYPEGPSLQRDTAYRTILVAPLLRGDTAIGTIVMRRLEVRPFSGKQIKLLETFADQAVIAIENVRLFKELEARTEALGKSVRQLTALGEVGQAISSTLDLETVLKTIVQRAAQITGLDGGEIFEYDERTEQFHLRAAENLDAEIVEALRRTPMRKGEGAVGRAGMTGEPTEIPEILDASYQSRVRELLVGSGYRALLAVPLLREDHLLGALVVNRKSPGRFSPEDVELLKTFATQSAVAIQNARLFREIAEKSRQLEEASRHKSQFLASMSHELRTPLNAILGFNEMILDEVYGTVSAEVRSPLEEMQSSGKQLLRLINNVLDLAKIEAGRMELALSDYSAHDIVENVRATLRPLAESKGLELGVSVPPDLPLGFGDPGRLAQCLMNLAGNSLKFTKAGRVDIAVELNGGAGLRYRVTDTGIGIPADKIGSLFTEFRQTDATIASEYGGTGLGLSITKKFVEMHRGRIWVESEPGKGSAFIFEIPLRA